MEEETPGCPRFRTPLLVQVKVGHRNGTSYQDRWIPNAEVGYAVLSRIDDGAVNALIAEMVGPR